jgi:hypothetical protein
MLLARWIVMVLLVAAGISFALYAGTGQPKYKKFGLAVLKWTLITAFGFFLVLFVQRVFA